MPVFLEENFFRLLGQKLLEQLNPVDKNLGEHIRATMDYSPLFTINLFGFKLAVTEAIVTMWITMVILAILGFWFASRLKINPTKKQTAVELLIDSVIKLCANSGLNAEQTKTILPFVTTMGLLLMISNCLSAFKLKPPAQNPSFPIVLALFTLGYIIFMTIKFIGLKGFWHSLIYPKASLLPFKILDIAIKPVSLSFRLFGNIFGSFILMEFVSLIVPAFIPGILGLWFDLGDGIIQGGIFAYLTIVYIGEFLENNEALLEDRREKELEKERERRKKEQQALSRDKVAS